MPPVARPSGLASPQVCEPLRPPIKNIFDYKLTYSNVGTTPPGAGTVTQAHIHFGKSRDSGGIRVFFCSNNIIGNGSTATSACPAISGMVPGTWTAASVLAIPTQNVNAGDVDALMDALNANTAYANVHTAAFGAGEIRGQCRSGDLDE